jgi:hypothetical protein
MTSSMYGRIRAFLAPAVVCAGFACASAGSNAHPGRSRQATDNRGATVYFKNDSWDQVAVYAFTTGLSRTRIGTVMAGRADTLTIPSMMINAPGGVNISTVPLGKNEVSETGPLMFRVGEAVEISQPGNQQILVVLPARRP